MTNPTRRGFFRRAVAAVAAIAVAPLAERVAAAMPGVSVLSVPDVVAGAPPDPAGAIWYADPLGVSYQSTLDRLDAAMAKSVITLGNLGNGFTGVQFSAESGASLYADGRAFMRLDTDSSVYLAPGATLSFANGGTITGTSHQ